MKFTKIMILDPLISTVLCVSYASKLAEKKGGGKKFDKFYEIKPNFQIELPLKVYSFLKWCMGKWYLARGPGVSAGRAEGGSELGPKRAHCPGTPTHARKAWPVRGAACGLDALSPGRSHCLRSLAWCAV